MRYGFFDRYQIGILFNELYDRHPFHLFNVYHRYVRAIDGYDIRKPSVRGYGDARGTPAYPGFADHRIGGQVNNRSTGILIITHHKAFPVGRNRHVMGVPSNLYPGLEFSFLCVNDRNFIDASEADIKVTVIGRQYDMRGIRAGAEFDPA